MKVFSSTFLISSFILIVFNSCSTGGNSISCDAGLGFDESSGDILLTSQKEVNNWNSSNTRVQGSLFIGYCSDRGDDDISDLTNLNGITEIDGDFIISNNRNLTTLEGLENLERIGGTVLILENYQLTSLEGLNNLLTIGGALNISAMDNLDTINSLKSLESIGGLYVWSNRKLKNIDGLSNLSQIEGPMIFVGNESLVNIEGLSNVVSSSIEFLRVESNAELLSLDGLEGIEMIASDGAESYSRNATIYRNPKLISIDALSNLTSVEGSIEVRWNNSLPTIEGLSGLTEVNGLLSITENPLMTNLDGLRNISSVSGNLDIFDNDLITNLDGLQLINNIGTVLSIFDNDKLTDLCGLTTLIQAEGGLNEGIFTTNYPYFNVYDNAFNPTREDLENNICVQ